MNIHSFLEMGGYAVFVWPSYGAAALLLAAFTLAAVRSAKKQQARLDALERAREQTRAEHDKSSRDVA